MNDLLDNFDHFGLRSRQMPKCPRSEYNDVRLPSEGKITMEPTNKIWPSFSFLNKSRPESACANETESQPMETALIDPEDMIKTEPEDFDPNCNLIGQRLHTDDATFSFSTRSGGKKRNRGQRLNPMFEVSNQISHENSRTCWTESNRTSYSGQSGGSKCIIAPARFQYVSSEELLNENNSNRQSVFGGQNSKHTKLSAFSPFVAIAEETSQNQPPTRTQNSSMDIDNCERMKGSYDDNCSEKVARVKYCEQEVLPCMAVSPTPRNAENPIDASLQSNGEALVPESSSIFSRGDSKLPLKRKWIRVKFRFTAVVAIISLLLNLILMGLIVVAVDSDCMNGQWYCFNHFLQNIQNRFANGYFLAA